MTTFNLSDLYKGTTSKDTMKQFVGASYQFPPNTTNLGAEWVAEEGVLILRSAYPALWQWVQATQGSQLLSDTDWLLLEADNLNGAVSVYSSGDGSTNFRVPSVGADGGFKRAKGTAVTDPVLLNIGFQDQIQNITGSYFTKGANAGFGYGAQNLDGAFFLSSAGNIYASLTGTGSEVGTGTVGFDASLVARTGDETHPKGQYVRYFIYTGADTAGVAPVATLEEILLATAQRSITYNNDITDAVINQRSFNGNWSALSVGDYGYDGWLKHSATHKAQVVEEGDYMPNKVHVVQYDGIRVGTITSPTGGHWLIAVPFSADNIDIRAGKVTVPFYVEDKEQRLSKCERYYERITNAGLSLPIVGMRASSNLSDSLLPFITSKREGVRELVFPALVNMRDGVGAGTASLNTFSEADGKVSVRLTTVGIGPNAFGPNIFFLTTGDFIAADASLTISDAGANITEVG